MWVVTSVLTRIDVDDHLGKTRDLMEQLAVHRFGNIVPSSNRQIPVNLYVEVCTKLVSDPAETHILD
jgi:hypothetical protein